jgi:hypothetical protein
MPSSADKQEQVWYDAAQVAKYFGIHVNTLKRIPETALPYMRFGARGDRRYHKADVEIYAIQRMVGR